MSPIPRGLVTLHHTITDNAARKLATNIAMNASRFPGLMQYTHAMVMTTTPRDNENANRCYIPILFSTADRETQQLVHVIHTEQQITSYEIFVRKLKWRALNAEGADVENAKGGKIGTWEAKGTQVDQKSFWNNKDWAKLLEGGHGIDDISLGLSARDS